MTKVRIVYKNLWRLGTILTPCCQHPEFPASDSQVASPRQLWRTRYGTGSGNGLFVVTDSNKYINFDEGGSELTGTLTTGSYNGATLATAIVAAMNAAPGKALTYICTYDESTAKFTIGAGSNFTIRWNTGTNKASDISDLCGFSDAADDTGANSYVSDYRRIHYPRAWVPGDIVNVVGANFFAIIGHNISSAATIKFIGADDSAFTTSVVEISISHYADSIFYFHSSTVERRYWGLQVQDPTNTCAYIQVGAVVVGFYWEPGRSFGKHAQGKYDPSEIDYSDSGSIFCQRRQVLDIWRLPFSALVDSDKDHVLALQEEVGQHSGIIVCTDYNSPNTSSSWVSLIDLIEVENKQYNVWGWEMIVREVM